MVWRDIVLIDFDEFYKYIFHNIGLIYFIYTFYTKSIKSAQGGESFLMQSREVSCVDLGESHPLKNPNWYISNKIIPFYHIETRGTLYFDIKHIYYKSRTIN